MEDTATQYNAETQRNNYPENEIPNMDISPGKNALAAVVAGIFVVGLGFLAFRHFNSITADKNLPVDQAQGEVQQGEIASGETDSRPSEEEIPGFSGTQDTVFAESVWTATDYSQGDIQKGTYTVRHGDTLWEIAEAVYGNGSQWTEILNANSTDIGLLADGSQALIFTGQTLIIP